MPPLEHVALIGINQAGSSASPSGFRKGAVAQPSLHRSPGYSNPRSNVSYSVPLGMKFNDLLISIQLLSTSCEVSLLFATRASRTLFFLRLRFPLFSFLLCLCLSCQSTPHFAPHPPNQALPP